MKISGFFFRAAFTIFIGNIAIAIIMVMINRWEARVLTEHVDYFHLMGLLFVGALAVGIIAVAWEN